MTFRTYSGDRTEAGDYGKLHDLLVESGNTEYTYARFDWMMTNWPYLEAQYLERIGLWEDDGKSWERCCSIIPWMFYTQWSCRDTNTCIRLCMTMLKEIW